MREINPADWDDDMFSDKMSSLERGDAIYEMFFNGEIAFL